MISTHVGDQARMLMFQRRAAALKHQTNQNAQEMTTGLARDKTHHLKGDLSILAATETAITRAQTRQSLAASALRFLDTQQSALSTVIDNVQSVQAGLLGLDLAPGPEQTGRMMRSLQDAFGDMIAALNTRSIGQSVFAGTASDKPAVTSAPEMLEALAATLPEGADTTTLAAAITQWFAPGGGFDLNGYQGAESIPAPFDLGEGLRLPVSLTARDSRLRSTLAALATGAILSAPGVSLSEDDRRALLHQSRDALQGSLPKLIDLSAEIGTLQERATLGARRAADAEAAFTMARNELLQIDPYEAASKLEEGMSQLDLLYALTARLSRLTLAEYLR